MTVENAMLDGIGQADKILTERYQSKLVINHDIDRRMVSFQANKAAVGHRWYKYKEGFSDSLMCYLFEKLGLSQGRLLEPFAGSGTALFAASAAGLDSTGIELLPTSAESIEVRKLLLNCDPIPLIEAIRNFSARRSWEHEGGIVPFVHIAITRGAFPAETEHLLCRYLYEISLHPNPDVKRILFFAAMCVLESISYTRKDGQFLRWDYRSGRRQPSKPFDKGKIFDFTEAIETKLREIELDIRSLSVPAQLFDAPCYSGEISLLADSCLDILPTLDTASFDGIVTSPPYANRYDYTRTYALELAMMGIGEEGIKKIRQAMLSCTVENKPKDDLAEQYPAEQYQAAKAAFDGQEMLQLILAYLEHCKANKTITNTGVPRMIRGYFAEMAQVIFQCARLLKSGSPFVMVNDNVRYMGAHIPVDLILSDFAVAAGFTVEKIWVLPRGKGNSSQQMGVHGREEVRKCVYVWRR